MILRRIALCVMGLVVSLALYRCTYQPIRCSRLVWRSEQELRTAAESDERSMRTRAANRAIPRLIGCNVRPLDPNVPMLMALSYRFLQRHDLAVRYYEEVIAIDRRPEAYLGLGIEQLALGQRAAALDSLTQACSFDPRLLDDIDDGQARTEVIQRLAATYGESWLK